MRKTKTQKGITLVALIITIIVLLILAVVAIGAVRNDGIIDHAKNARQDYSAAQTNESTLLGNYLDKINANAPQTENEEETPQQPGTPGDSDENDGIQDDSDTTITKITTILGEGTIELGLTRTLVAYDQDNKPIPAEDLYWTSSDESIATVSNGVVSGVKVTDEWVCITATYKKNPEISWEAEMAGVYGPFVDIGIRVGNSIVDNASISKDEKVTVYAHSQTELSGWVWDEPLIWEIADPTIVSVTDIKYASAKITGLKSGTTTITVKHPLRENVTATITITVTE